MLKVPNACSSVPAERGIKNMRHLIRFLCLGLALVLLCGCIEMDEEYTVNPDGSGKVVRQGTVDATGMMGGLGALTGLKKPSAKEMEEVKKGFVGGMLQNSSGIEVWKDVTAETLPDGRIKFKGTGYFKEISAVSSMAGNQPSSGEAGFTLSKGAKETLVLEMKDPGSSLPIGKSSSSNSKKSEKEIADQIKKGRDDWQAAKALMGSMFSKLKIKQTFHLPGKVTEVTNFKNEGGAVTLSIEGDKLLQTIDGLFADDKFMRLQVEAESDPAAKQKLSELTMEKMFGSKGPVRAVATGPHTALFDYQAEASEAKKSYPALLKQYELAGNAGRQKAGSSRAAPSAKPVPAVVGDTIESTDNQFLPRLKRGETFTSLKVSEVRWPRPPRSGAAAPALKKITVTVFGQLPGTILDVNFGKVLSAVEDGGASLLAAEEWDRQMFVFKLVPDKNAVSFDVNLFSRSGKVAKIKELSGTLEVTLGGLKDFDLGLTEFKPDARGTVFDTRIRSINREGGRETLYLQFNQKRETVSAMAFLDASGQKLNGTVKNWSSVGENSIVGYSLDGVFPANGKVKVAIIETAGKTEIPFKLENASLTDVPPP
jgi:hypothetical protein